MPELPEVETVRRGLQPVLEGARLVNVEARRPDLRFPFPERFSERLAGKTVTALGRRAKYLTMHIENGPVLICHLGMSGSFRVETAGNGHIPGSFHHERSKSAAHDHVVFDVDSPKGERSRVIFNDPRRFGFMLFADGPLLASLLEGRRSPLKAALLDQRLIAGLGNIYVSEALWRAGLSPLREAGTIAGSGKRAKEQCERLAAAIRSVIADAIAAGGSSLRDYVQADGSLGYFQHSFAVYDREGEPCPKPGCSGHIKRIVQSGRSTFYCRTCQR
ncbi:MAG: Fpg/Nei family DNA glycosylase [Mesorhizobium sp.]|nr:MAG: Fpg/Nei family DNA glycosylase [Mesorhizobium sp.]